MTTSINHIESDIKSLKIQGATNVAMAVLTALEKNPDKNIGTRLAYARPTEPLAQNAIRYIFDNGGDIQTYKSFLSGAKSAISSYGKHIIEDGKIYLTHCHSSTITNICINAGKKISVIATETRPLLQGRITVKELLDGGLTDVTMIVDSAVASVLSQRQVAAVFVGADLLSEQGFVNKIGTLAIVLAARAQNIPVYCFSTLLKYDPRPFDKTLIETRDTKEIWPEAPAGLTIYAPAFDFTPYDEIRIVCEAGIIEGNQVKKEAQTRYPFITNA